MKGKINRRMFIIGAFSILITGIITIIICYGLFKEQVFDSLKMYSELVMDKYLDDENKMSSTDYLEESLRVTIIDVDGTVLYDSIADVNSMDNHSNRPEIIRADKEGDACEVRKSSTVGKSTYYYASKLEDGTIFRVSKITNNVFSIFGEAFPIVIFVLMIFLILCYIIINKFTEQIISPIKKMIENIDDIQQNAVYDELRPLAEIINEQHQNIKVQMSGREKMRIAFTANVSHELKTPLTSISGYAELIESGMVKEEDIKAFSGKIHKESGRLLNLINDIIKLSELDENVVQTKEFVRLRLYDILKSTVNALRLLADKNNILLEVKGAPGYIYGDIKMIEELVYNLCDNAIRYSKPNGIVVLKLYEDEGHVYLSVKDDGIGIPKEHHEFVFERFYRVDKSHSKATGGTGLGLSIVKHIALNHRAEIRLESEENVGTEITVIFNKEQSR